MRKFSLFSLIVALLLVGAASATYAQIGNVSPLDGYNDYARAPTSWDTLLGNGSINYLAWPGGYDLIVGLNYTSTTNDTLDYFDIMAGDNPPAFRSSIGNLTYSDLAAGNYWIGPLESARFKNATGYLQVSSGYITGTISIMKVAN